MSLPGELTMWVAMKLFGTSVLLDKAQDFKRSVLYPLNESDVLYVLFLTFIFLSFLFMSWLQLWFSQKIYCSSNIARIMSSGGTSLLCSFKIMNYQNKKIVLYSFKIHSKFPPITHRWKCMPADVPLHYYAIVRLSDYSVICKNNQFLILASNSCLRKNTRLGQKDVLTPIWSIALPFWDFCV